MIPTKSRRVSRALRAALLSVGLAIVIVPGPAAAAGTASISGTVLNGAGQMPPGFAGAVLCPGTSIPPGAPPPPPCTFAFGNPYSFTALEAGTYTVDGFGSTGQSVGRADTPVTLTVAGGEVATVNFVLGSRIQGHVTDPNGAPVAGATVRLEVGGPIGLAGNVATTNATGDYLTPYLGTGTVTVKFIGPAGSNLLGVGTVAVGINSIATLDAQLVPAVTISGTVLDGAGIVLI